MTWPKYVMNMERINNKNTPVYAAGSGSHVRSTRRQSMPSSSIDNCARVSDRAPLSALVQMKRPRSNRLVKRQSPSLSAHRSFTMSPLRPLKMNT